MAVQHYRGRYETASLVAPLIGSLSKMTGPALALIEVVAGILLVVGAWTQVAAIIAIIMCIKALMVKPRLKSLAPLSHSTYLLLLIMSLSLLVTGAGAFGFDIPML